MPRFLVHFELPKIDTQGLAKLVPRIIDALKRASDDDYEQAYRSEARDVFGFFVKTDLPAVRLRARFSHAKDQFAQPDESKPATVPILRSQDKILVVEIGRDFDCAEFYAKVEPWLKHH